MTKKTIKFATGNIFKVKEGNHIAKDFDIKFIQLKENYPEIRHERVEEVAHAGAEYIYAKVQEPVIVEDTGMYIKALNGFPGSYSKFVLEKIGNEGILYLMKEKDNKKAVFISSIGYCDGNITKVISGEVSGTIVDSLRGENGFGYDPIFKPDGYDKTFAEDYELKKKISHRGRAFKSFCDWFKSLSQKQDG